MATLVTLERQRLADRTLDLLAHVRGLEGVRAQGHTHWDHAPINDHLRRAYERLAEYAQALAAHTGGDTWSAKALHVATSGLTQLQKG